MIIGLTLLFVASLTGSFVRLKHYWKNPERIIFIWGFIAGQSVMGLLYVVIGLRMQIALETQSLFHLGGQ